MKIRANAARVAASLGVAAVVAVLALSAAGCSVPGSGVSSSKPAAKPPVPASFPVTITDDASRTVTIAKAPARIVSLAPANTEVLFASGVPTSAIVGVTTFDDYPPGVKSLPKVGDFMNPNIEAITAARPDLILATGGVQQDVIAKLEATGAKVVVIDPKSLDGLYVSIAKVGKVTGHAEGAFGLVDWMQAAIEAISSKVATEAPTTTFLEVGYNPLYTAGSGTLIDDLIAAAGGANVVKQSGYVPYSVEALLKADPKVYLAVKGTSGDPGAIAARPGFDKLTAVKEGRIVILDDNLVTRPGPRVVLGVEAIAKALHPDAFK
jgi:iron complex transport system substrate-binding protein